MIQKCCSWTTEKISPKHIHHIFLWLESESNETMLCVAGRESKMVGDIDGVQQIVC